MPTGSAKRTAMRDRATKTAGSTRAPSSSDAPTATASTMPASTRVWKAMPAGPLAPMARPAARRSSSRSDSSGPQPSRQAPVARRTGWRRENSSTREARRRVDSSWRRCSPTTARRSRRSAHAHPGRVMIMASPMRGSCHRATTAIAAADPVMEAICGSTSEGRWDRAWMLVDVAAETRPVAAESNQPSGSCWILCPTARMSPPHTSSAPIR